MKIDKKQSIKMKAMVIIPATIFAVSLSSLLINNFEENNIKKPSIEYIEYSSPLKEEKLVTLKGKKSEIIIKKSELDKIIDGDKDKVTIDDENFSKKEINKAIEYYNKKSKIEFDTMTPLAISSAGLTGAAIVATVLIYKKNKNN